MARILNITGEASFARIVDRYLKGLGHEVLTVPFPMDSRFLLAFKPEAIVLSLARREGALGDRIQRHEDEVIGLDAYRALSHLNGRLKRVPLIVLGRGLTRSCLPAGMKDVEYAMFTTSLRQLKAALTRALSSRVPAGSARPEAPATSDRAELGRRVEAMSEAEVHTVLKFVQFLEEDHIRPRVGSHGRPMAQARAIVEDLVEIAEILEEPEVEVVYAPRRPEGARADAQGRSWILEGATEVPPEHWAVTLDGFSHVFHDLDCHLWVQTENGDVYTLAREVPLGQIYFDQKGSERNAVQVAVNRSGTVYSDFRFMHRIPEPERLYLRSGDDELADVIVERAGKFTVLEVSLPEAAAPGVRGLAFLDRIKAREAASR